MSDLRFDDNKVAVTGTTCVDSSAGGAAAAFDPENPEEAPLVIAPLDPDAGFLQKATYYTQVSRAYVRDKTKNLRPWKDFADHNEFAIPSKLTALANVSHNLSYWGGNYAIIALVLFVYTALTNIVLTVGLICCFSLYQYVKSRTASGEPISVGGKELSPAAAYASVAALSVLTFYLSGGASATFWLVTISSIVCLGHAATRKPIEAGVNVNPAFSFA